MFDLPEPVPYRLARPPLVQALIQLRYPMIANLGTLPGVAPLQGYLQERLPYMGPASSNTNVQLGPAGAAVSPGPQDGWEFADEEGHRLQLVPGTVNLVADHRYKGVEKFADLLNFCLSGLVAIESVTRCTRLGVRYLSIVEPAPDDEFSWMDWFRTEVQGWGSSRILNATLDASVNRVQIKGHQEGNFANFPAPAQGLVNTGWLPGGALISGLPPVSLKSPAFILDFDFSVEANQPFEAATLVEQFRALHSQMDRFFRWSLTETGQEYFGLEET